MSAQMPLGSPVGERFAVPGIFAGLAPAPTPPPVADATAVHEDAKPTTPPPPPWRDASGPSLRRLGLFCRDLANRTSLLKLLVALLVLPVGLLVNRDLLRDHFDPVKPEGKLMIAMAWIVALLPALALGWLYGFLVAWCVWAGLGNLAAIAAYRVALHEADPR
jgi:hypothetical protein